MSLRSRLSALRLRAIGLLPPRWRSVFFYPPGHFYSPLPDFTRSDGRGRIAGDDETAWEHIGLNSETQRAFYQELIAQTKLLDFPGQPGAPSSSFRYHTENDMFRYGDAFMLSAVLQRYRPRQVIEVGSGFSSAVMLDTADACGLETRFTFIEIYPQRLRRLLRDADTARVVIDERSVQDVPLAAFDALQAGDILFIDSSHVAKIGSDVTHLLLRVLPRLRPGVIVHVHDIFYPESYPAEWLLQGRAWNESLFLRAFLTGNRAFRVTAFNAFAAQKFPNLFAGALPRFLADPGGSLWLEKVE